MKTSGNQFYICRVLLEYYNCGECKCLVNIGLWSSILPPWRVSCVHKNWSWVPLPAFFGNKDQQRTTATPKNIFHERHLYNGRYTQLTCLSVACRAVRYEFFSLIFITCNQLISISFKTFCILTFKEKHFPWTFKH